MTTEQNKSNWQRTHHLGELSAKDIGKTVTLNGWVNKRRDHGKFLFIDLRDRYGLTQVTIDPDLAPQAHAQAMDIKNEYVLTITGKVMHRPDGQVNKSMATGEIEIQVQSLSVLNTSDVLPFAINDESDATETTRLKYRYLDLRRPSIKQNIISRVKFVSLMRRALEERNFLDIETPFLYKSTPEGAREFLVPSRIHSGHFYALPQSPQLFKQVLMIAGFDRYYQIVKCFRDEDLRADRQPEFTQVDIEMSFVDEAIVVSTLESVTKQVVKGFTDGSFDDSKPFPKMTYAQAMEDYGVDKPDTRFEMKLRDISAEVKNSGFGVFKDAVAAGGIVNTVVVKGAAESFSRKDIDELTEYVKSLGAKGLAWIKKQAGQGVSSWNGPIAKFFDDATTGSIDQKIDLTPGDIVFFGAGPWESTKSMLGALRNRLGARQKLTDPKKLNFLWITEFPLLEKDVESNRWLARHHPFTSPRPEDTHLLESAPEKVRASAYDLVLNGYEVAGGSIRIHDQELQKRLFARIGLTPEEAQSKFGFLLEALKFGAPPHGGMAFGVDRMVMCLIGVDAIRDVIAFPKTQKGTCLMTGAPTLATEVQLKDLHVSVVKPPEKT
jgi:aspartyl-tRNA synthetase